MATTSSSNRKKSLSEEVRSNRKKRAEANKDARKNRRRRLQALPFSAGANTLSRKAGLLTCPPRRRLPGPGGPVAQECRNEKALAGGTHSSGNCCRFTRHSLLIPLHGETIARQRYTFIGRKQAIRRNISAKRAPPLCAADRSDHDASLFRQTAARLWHALCTYFSQLRHSNRSEVSSFI